MFSKISAFFKESKDEMVQHVTWSSYDELQKSSFLVLIASLVFALLIGLIDLVFRVGLDQLYSIKF